MTSEEFSNRRHVEMPPNSARIHKAIDDELAFHIDERVRELIASGVQPHLARDRASAEFGGLDATRRDLQRIDADASRRQSLVDLVADFWIDLRRTTRVLSRRPGYVIIAAFTLALGIGANATMFAVTDRLLLSPPPHIRDARDVVHLRFDEAQAQSGRIIWVGAPYPFFIALRDAKPHFDVAGYTNQSMPVRAGETHRTASVTAVTSGYFSLLGTRPEMGRFFDGDASGERPVVISHSFWTRDLASADVVGTHIRLNGERYTIVGVAPRGFTGAGIMPVDAFIPLGSSPALPVGWQTRQNLRMLMVVARPHPGTTPPTMEAEATRLYQTSRRELPQFDSTARVVTATLVPGRKPEGEMTTDARVTVWLQGVSILVLIIAIANVANLMLLRGLERRRETAVAVALGVSRTRLLRGVMLESLLLGALAALMAVMLSRWSGPFLWSLLLPMGADVATTPLRDSILTGLIALGSVLAMSAVPVALQLRTKVSDVLREAARGSSTRGTLAGDALVVTQVACAVVLLVGSGLFVRSMWRLDGLNLGFEVNRIVAVHIDHGQVRDAEGAARFLRDAEARVRALPGVDLVSTSLTAPYRPSYSPPIYVAGHERLPGVGPGALGYPSFIAVSPQFFQVLGLTLQQGRGFEAGDGAAASFVTIVDATMARTFWPAGDAIGRCIRIGADTMPCRTVVGIVQDSKRSPIETNHSLRYYLPLAQAPVSQTNHYLFARTALPTAALVAPVRDAVLGSESPSPVVEVLPMTKFLEPYTRPWRLGRAVFVAFGVLATTIAAIGLYGVISYGIVQRRRELGIRLALGATRGAVLRLVLGGAGKRTVVGLVAGSVGAVLLGSGLRDLLFQTSPTDGPAFVGSMVVVLLATIIACIVPVTRAVRVDPTITLKAE
ncbi:MAG TPA: ABC transporter permease [Gemmatimonadaceae bacterium]|nr:ABC transporter permease [Gemmatimonadaceae bacterium]